MGTKLKHHYGGWKPQTPDHRDEGFKIIHPEPTVPLPAMVDLRPTDPPIYDQGNIGRCTGASSNAHFEAELMKQGLTDFTPSMNFTYYNGRALEGDTDQDNGAQIRDVMKGLATLGACPVSEWSDDESNFANKPTPQCYVDALKNKVLSYHPLLQNEGRHRRFSPG